MEIQKLEPEEISRIYETYMKEDFPKNELKPFKALETMLEKGVYEGLGFYHSEELIAYAFFVKHAERKTLLLDYFAVCAEHRAGGVGSAFLAQMKEFFADRQAILLECESISCAGSEEERITRSRRINFYVRNGSCKTPTKSELFGVEYDILYIPLGMELLNVMEELNQLYQQMFPAELFGTRVRLWQRHGIMKEALRWNGRSGKLEEKRSLLTALGLIRDGKVQAPQVISLVGAGGKTTTMYQLADELAEQGLRVLITTSTHIACPEDGWVLKDKTLAEAAELEWNERILILGNTAEGDKLSAPADLGEDAAMAAIRQKADMVLIEADGSKRHPLKVPAEWEPVLIRQTEMVIACAGLSAIGQTFGQGCFRIDTDGAWLHRTEADMITAEDVALVLMDERGCRKGVTALADYRYQIILNQADGKAEELAIPVIELLPVTMKHGCVVTEYTEDTEDTEDQ